MAKRLVHWALETLGSPSIASEALHGHPADESTSTASSTEESNAATLQYVNSQLLAHGFTYKPGLSLDGASTEDAERVLKCLVAMLGGLGTGEQMEQGQHQMVLTQMLEERHSRQWKRGRWVQDDVGGGVAVDMAH